jgi:hypothetical protein
MEPEVVFLPDPFLEEGPTAVQDVIRLARTQHSPSSQAALAPPLESRLIMAQRQPQAPRSATAMAQASPRSMAHVVAPLARYVQEALDPLEDELAFVEEATLMTGGSVSRMYQGSDQLTQITLGLARQRRTDAGFVDAEDEWSCRERQRRFEAEMEGIYADGSFPPPPPLRVSLDNGPMPQPQPRLGTVASRWRAHRR